METIETEIVKPDEIRQELAKQSITETLLKEMESTCLSLKLKSPTDKEGYNVIYENYQKVVKTRTTIEKAFDNSRAELTRKSKLNLADKAEMVKLLTPSEEHLLAQREIFENEQDRIKQEDIKRLQDEENARLEAIRKAEEEKQKKIQTRQQALNRTGAVIEPLNGYDHYSIGEWHWQVELLMTCSEDDFHRHLRGASVEAEKIKMAKEKEAAELKAKQDDVAETQRKQKEEREALEREKSALAEEKRLTAEAKDREEKEHAEIEYKKFIAKGEKRFKELQKYGLNVKDGPLGEAEEIRLLAEKSDEHFEILKNDWIRVAEDNKKHAAERAEALKPDIQKLREFAAELKKIKIPACTSNDGKKIALDAKDRLSDQSADIISLIKNLR